MRRDTGQNGKEKNVLRKHENEMLVSSFEREVERKEKEKKIVEEEEKKMERGKGGKIKE